MRTLPLLCFLFPAVAFGADVDLLAAYSQLREITLDPQRVAAVESLELKKDAATFRFKTGNPLPLQAGAGPLCRSRVHR